MRANKHRPRLNPNLKIRVRPKANSRVRNNNSSMTTWMMEEIALNADSDHAMVAAAVAKVAADKAAAEISGTIILAVAGEAAAAVATVMIAMIETIKIADSARI